jgi:hypothetical protein
MISNGKYPIQVLYKYPITPQKKMNKYSCASYKLAYFPMENKLASDCTNHSSSSEKKRE